MLLSISVSMVILVVECVDQQIPGPHYPIATGAPGDELVYTGTTPSFLSYHAVDNEGKKINDQVRDMQTGRGGRAPLSTTKK